MGKLNDDTRKSLLSTESILRSDKDLATIASLNDIAKQQGYVFVQSGGYAVETYCGGMISRPHGDIDGRLLVSDNSRNQELFSEVHEMLKKQNGF